MVILHVFLESDRDAAGVGGSKMANSVLRYC